MTMEDVTVEAIREALEESGETLSDAAINNIAAWVDGNYENRSLMFPTPEHPAVSELSELRRTSQNEVAALEAKHRREINDLKEDHRWHVIRLRKRIRELEDQS